MLAGDTLIATICYLKIIKDSLIRPEKSKRKKIESYLQCKKEVEALNKIIDVIMEGYRMRNSDTPITSKNNKILDIKNSLKVLESYDKDLMSYIKALYLFYVEKRYKEAIEEIENFIDRSPPIIDAYVDFWKIAQISNDHSLGIKISDVLSYLLRKKDYPNDLWMKANIIISKSLILDHEIPKFEEAKSVLHQLSQVLPPLPLPPNSEYETMTFSENQIFYTMNEIQGECKPEEVVRNTSFIEEDEIAEAAEEASENLEAAKKSEAVEITESSKTNQEVGAPKISEKPKEDNKTKEIIESSRPPVLKIDNPQLNYVKKVNHEKKSSAFQEHMAIQFEVKKEFPNTGPVTSCGKIRVFSL